MELDDGEFDLIAAGRSILSLEAPLRLQERVVTVSASIGGAVFPQDARSAKELLTSADIALYALKRAGRGGTKMFEQYMREQAQLLASQLSLARNMIGRQAVVPHYQPKIHLQTGEVAGFEALLRWNHAHRGLQSPDTISEAFKTNELASQIGAIMQSKVFADLRRWLDDGVPVEVVAINAAPAEFLRDDFAEHLLESSRAATLSPVLSGCCQGHRRRGGDARAEERPHPGRLYAGTGVPLWQRRCRQRGADDPPDCAATLSAGTDRRARGIGPLARGRATPSPRLHRPAAPLPRGSG